MLDLASFEAVTFDCYGTRIDWESGIAAAIGAILERHGITATRAQILELHARLEPAAQSGDYRPYREVLATVVDGFGERHGFRPTAAERYELARSIADWPIFEDTNAALGRLAAQFRLAILSNIDDALFALTVPRLTVDFDAIVTAEQVRAYKPARPHFEAALERLEVARERVLHVAQSLFHDIAPARALGISTVWVNRRQGLAGPGATPPASAVPDLEVPDLATLAELAA